MTRLRALACVLLLGVTALLVTGSAISAAAGPSTPELAAAKLPVAAVRLTAQPAGGVGSALVTEAVPGPSPAWLIEVNRYRAGAGLAPVTDQPQWDAGILSHLTYVADSPKSALTGAYASLHTENPASAYFTTNGALEASRSDLFFGSTSMTPVNFIDGWLSAPFHAIGILRPRLTQVAFASAPSGGAAGLDVIGGIDDARPPATMPVLFPGNGTTTNLTSYSGGESPDPLETCGWSASPSNYGLPLIALLPTAPTGNLQASVVGPDGRVQSTANGGLCLVDEVDYRSTDEVYGPTGRQILQDDHAVLLIARVPYRAGSYSATITQSGTADARWSFAVTP